MKKSTFTEEQIVSILKKQDLGLKVADIARKHGITEATIHKWKNKYGGLGAELTSALIQTQNSEPKTIFTTFRKKLPPYQWH